MRAFVLALSCALLVACSGSPLPEPDFCTDEAQDIREATKAAGLAQCGDNAECKDLVILSTDGVEQAVRGYCNSKVSPMTEGAGGGPTSLKGTPGCSDCRVVVAPPPLYGNKVL